MAKINRDDMILSDTDKVEKYILLSNSHDGGSAVRIGYTPYRVSCSNSLSVAENSNKSQLIRVYHKKNVYEVVCDIQETMNIIDQTFKTTEEKYRELMEKPINTADLKKYVLAVFSRKDLEKMFTMEADIPEKEFQERKEQIEKEEISKAQQKLIERVEEIFDVEYAKHKQANAWTAYNSVNYILNHEKSRTQESAYHSLWFHQKGVLDRKALTLASRL